MGINIQGISRVFPIRYALYKIYEKKVYKEYHKVQKGLRQMKV